MKKLELLGQRWLDRGVGNTYHVAAAVLDGKVVARVPFSYGYDDQWLYHLTEELSKVAELHGLPINKLSGEKYPMTPWQYVLLLENSGCHVFTNVEDVRRRKDLVL